MEAGNDADMDEQSPEAAGSPQDDQQGPVPHLALSAKAAAAPGKELYRHVGRVSAGRFLKVLLPSSFCCLCCCWQSQQGSVKARSILNLVQIQSSQARICPFVPADSWPAQEQPGGLAQQEPAGGRPQHSSRSSRDSARSTGEQVGDRQQAYNPRHRPVGRISALLWLLLP
jgi:hypothetical protein